MERSAINSYTTAGAFLGLLLGLHVTWSLIGVRDPAWLFTIAGWLAILPTAATWLLVSRRFQHAGQSGRMFLAVSGWFVLAGSMVALLVGIDRLFPKAVAG